MNSPDRPVPRTQRRSDQPIEPGPPPLADVDEPFDLDSLYPLRATLAAHASNMGADQEQIDHLLIVAGELASNAIRHGGGSGRLRLWQQDDTLYCQVTDHGPGFTDPQVGTTPPDPKGPDGGRGLWICRNLTTNLSIQNGTDGSGAVVTAAIPPPHTPSTPEHHNEMNRPGGSGDSSG